MKIHEYQAKEIFRQYGVTVPEGKVAYTPQEAENIAKELGGGTVVVKAQIHAGGRGKGGGVKIAKNPADAKKLAQDILGMNLKTHQTGPEGQEVKKILVEQGLDIAKEFYLGIVLDRETSKVNFIASSEGGMEIEVVAAKSPEKIVRQSVDPTTGFLPFQGRKLAYALGLEGKAIKQAVKFMHALYKVYVENDATLLEINPLILTKGGDIMALDAKMNFDDNALFRHSNISELRDLDEEDPKEIEASKFNLSYISLDGNIGCMVNGAGLAMATMDIIKLSGAEPANFLDVGGGANTEQVTAAFKILLADPNVKGVLVNIFGGILKCDVIAEGIVTAAKEVKLNVPLVVRLEGTNFERGRQILKDSGLAITPADGMKDAAKKVTQIVN